MRRIWSRRANSQHYDWPVFLRWNEIENNPNFMLHWLQKLIWEKMRWNQQLQTWFPGQSELRPVNALTLDFWRCWFHTPKGGVLYVLKDQFLLNSNNTNRNKNVNCKLNMYSAMCFCGETGCSAPETLHAAPRNTVSVYHFLLYQRNAHLCPRLCATPQQRRAPVLFFFLNAAMSLVTRGVLFLIMSVRQVVVRLSALWSASREKTRVDVPPEGNSWWLRLPFPPNYCFLDLSAYHCISGRFKLSWWTILVLCSVVGQV